MAITLLRSITDFMYLLYIIIKFRTAYAAPPTLVFGTGELVRDPKAIAWRYVKSNLALDVFAMLPLPQVWLYHKFCKSGVVCRLNLPFQGC